MGWLLVACILVRKGISFILREREREGETERRNGEKRRGTIYYWLLVTSYD